MSSKRFTRSVLWAVVLALAALLTVAVIGVAAAPTEPLAQSPAAAKPANTENAGPGACVEPQILLVNDTLAQSAPAFTDANWMKFSVKQNARYRLEVSDAAGLQIAVTGQCGEEAPAVALHNGQLEFTAERDAVLYLQVKRNGIAGAGVQGYQVTLSPAAPHRPSAMPLADVPDALVRRATEFLEELRGSDMAPEWKDARVNPNARIFYRPDIQEAAYYEFTVEKPVGNGWEPAGFIEMSTAEHDFVMTTWNMTGISPTAEIEEVAPLGVKLTEFYRLEMQNYAAEYEEPTALGISTVATDVVTLGGLPDQMEGLADVPDEAYPLITETTDDLGNTTYEGPDDPVSLGLSEWESWQALKNQYGEAYAPVLRSLESRASREWEQEKNLKQYGETLIKGDERTVHGLAGQTLAAIAVTGDGAAAQYLQQEPLNDNGTPTGVRLTVLDEPADKETLLPIEVKLTYTSEKTETIKYSIVNSAALVHLDIFMPLVGRSTNKSQQASAASAEAPAGPRAPDGDWGPWSYWWATGNAGGIRYNQIPAHQRVNTSNCWSGCGATAWAMLFAWFDQNKPAHWGLYRVNGGYGANVMAPFNQDAGVDNMTWELRGRLGTFCSGSGGATYFSRMIDAANYVRPRATAAWSMRTRYDPTKLCWFGACNAARDTARTQITNARTPAIVGTDNHYPMAYGYAHRSRQSCFLWWCSTEYSRWFYLNQGWGGSGNGWVNHDDVHFAATFN